MKTLIYVCCTLLLLGSARAQDANTTNIQLAFEHMVGTTPLELGNVFQTESGEKFTPRSFKYYVSDIGFVDDSGKFYLAAANVFLVNEAEAESRRIAFKLPPGNYKNLRFTIGVDSARSVAGVQEGALDPYNGMFWTWNTGFIAAKLEGTSPVSSMPQKLFQYDIGGYRTGQNAVRTIDITLDSGFVFRNNQNTLLSIKVDILKWFNGRHELKIAGHPFVHTPGALALQYADNYAGMFSLLKMRRY